MGLIEQEDCCDALDARLAAWIANRICWNRRAGRISNGAQPLLIAPVYQEAKANPPEAARIKQYRDALRAAAEIDHVPYLEIRELTEAGYPANIALFGELIHPNYEGHKLITRELLRYFAAHDMLRSLNVPQNP